MEELMEDVSAGDVSAGDVVTVSGNTVEPVVPEASIQTYETVVDISPLVNAVETQTTEMQKGFFMVAMLLGIIVGMIFMNGFFASRG